MGTLKELCKELPSFLFSVLERSSAVGLSVAIRRADDSASFCCGKVAQSSDVALDESCSFEIGCLSTLLLSIVVLEAERRGRISIHAPIATILPELDGSSFGERVCLWHVMCGATGHRGLGLRKLHEAIDWSEYARQLLDAYEDFEPGSVFNLHMGDQAILSEVVSRFHDEDIRSVLKRRFSACVSELEEVRHVAGHAWHEAARRYTEEPLALMPPLLKCGELRASPQGLTTIVADFLRPTADAWEDKFQDCLARSFAHIGVPINLGSGLGDQALRLPVWSGPGFVRHADGWVGATGVTQGHCCAVRWNPLTSTVFAVSLNTASVQTRDVLCRALARLLDGNNLLHQQMTRATAFEIRELVGHYVGGTEDDPQIDVMEEQGEVVCCVTHLNRKFELRYRWHEGVLVSCRSSIPLAINFFRNPSSMLACIQFGTRAFRRV